MLRIPGSYNSKLIDFSGTGEIAPSEAELRIIQTWNVVRPSIKPMLTDFYIYLADAKIKEIQQRGQAGRKRTMYINYNHLSNATTISWIKTLLETPICDYRKYAIWRILVP